MRRLYVTALVLALMPYCSVGAAEVAGKWWANPQECARYISMHGAKAALGDIYKNKGSMKFVLHQIATGDPGWLNIAGILASVSDAGASEDLQDAVSEGLRQRPAEVLRFVKQSPVRSADNVSMVEFNIAGACSASPRDGVEASLAYLEKAEEAVEKMSEPDLMKEREECLTSLKNSRAEIKRPIPGK